MWLPWLMRAVSRPSYRSMTEALGLTGLAWSLERHILNSIASSIVPGVSPFGLGKLWRIKKLLYHKVPSRQKGANYRMSTSDENTASVGRIIVVFSSSNIVAPMLGSGDSRNKLLRVHHLAKGGRSLERENSSPH